MRTRSPLLPALASALALAGCAGTSDDPAPPSQTPSVRRVEGAPATSSGSGAQRTPLTLSSPPLALAPFGSTVAAASAQGVFTVDGSGAPALVPLAAAAGEPTTTGAVSALARRGTGILAASANGLFHDYQGALLLSPLTKSLPAGAIVAMDDFGTGASAGASEEVWVSTASGFFHVASGQVEAVNDSALDAPPELVLALDAGHALAAGGGRVVDVNLAAKTTAVLATDLGHVNGADRDASGTAWLATEHGLLGRDASGALTLRTFAPAGEPGAAVHGVAASPGGALVALDSALVQVTGDSAQIAAPLTKAGDSHALAVSSDGTAWVVDGGALVRFRVPVTFAQLKPFFSNHCLSCHAGGAQGAPKIAFDVYDTAKAYGPTLTKRVKAEGVSPMPPESAEILSPSDVSLVVRWSEGGYLP